MAVMKNEKVSPNLVRLGVLKDGDTVSFVINNEHDIPFEGYVQGCSCLGTIERTDTELKCDLIAKFEKGLISDNGSPIAVVTDGTNYYRALPFGQGKRAYNLNTNQYEDIPLEGLQPVVASKFDQIIVAHFKDGEPNMYYNPMGKYEDNPAKQKANIKVVFYIIKD
jgi:hypothetical protein